MNLCKVLRFVPLNRLSLCRFVSSQSPTFSSTDSKTVARLGPHNIASMIFRGKPNIPFPDSYQVDLDTFKPAALSALSVITEAMSRQEWDSLEDLVEDECLDKLKNIIQNQTPEENQLVQIKPEDVFFSFISNAENCKSGKDLNLVTFSLPNLGN